MRKARFNFNTSALLVIFFTKRDDINFGGSFVPLKFFIEIK